MRAALQSFRRSWGAVAAPFRNDRRLRWAAIAVLLAVVILLPFTLQSAGDKIDFATTAGAYVVMALGLNIVVGFAGLLDLGYVAFYALGALTMGWLGSAFAFNVNHGKGVHIGVSSAIGHVPGIHVDFLIILVASVIVCAVAGMIIGLPTLRLRGDYIAIVTLAFGEIVYRFALNGDQIKFGSQQLTNGSQGITPVDKVDLPFLQPFQTLNLRPWYWTIVALAIITLFVNARLRESRLGRAWIAIREDEVAAASMGVPLVRTKLLAYATGAAFGGMAGAFLASYLNTVNSDQFQFAFSIFVLSMIILGGLGSIWGVALGAVALTFVNRYLIPDVLNPKAQSWFHFDLTQLSFSIFGFLLVIMMLVRPEGLLPERRRKLELAEGVGAGADEALIEVRA
ncbi:MAG: branched-chain amino acid ABC transporter permease [Thermoleophilaceae bacterium]